MVPYQFTSLAASAEATAKQATKTLEQTRLTLKAVEAYVVSKTAPFERSNEHKR